MDWRTRKQLTIITAALLIVAGFGAAVFYSAFRVAASCTDERKNQGEEEVDCGGPCTPCAFKRQKAVEIFFAKFIKVREANYDIAAEIHNPNDHLAAYPLTYRVRLYDDQGAEIARREGSTYIYPDDKIYVVESNFITERTVARAQIEIVKEKSRWIFTTDIRPDLSVLDKKFEAVNQNGSEAGRASGKLLNRSPFGYQTVDIYTALLDAAGNVLLVAKTALSNIESGETRAFQITWPMKPEGAVARIEMRPRTNILNPANGISF